MATTLEEQLTKYLTDAHSIEAQALTQLERAPNLAEDPQLSEIFRHHLDETKEHERLVRERLQAHDASPATVKEIVMRAGGVGFLLFAALNPDTPGKLTAHAYSYEHLEYAGYDLLSRVAERAGDQETVEVARRIRENEGEMAERLAGAFDIAVDASLRTKEADNLEEHLVKYLADAHAIESQAIQLLQRGPKIAGHPELARLYEAHLEETREHARLIEERLEAHDGKPSRLKDAVMRLGALNWGLFFQSHPDTPGKLAAFAFAFEHLEIGGYEELKRVAVRAGDTETAEVVERIIGEERAAAEKLAGSFDDALDASLEEVGATA